MVSINANMWLDGLLTLILQVHLMVQGILCYAEMCLNFQCDLIKYIYNCNSVAFGSILGNIDKGIQDYY